MTAFATAEARTHGDDVGGLAGRAGEDLLGRRDVLVADEVQHDAGLARGHVVAAQRGAGTGTFVQFGTGHYRFPVFSWPAWKRNVRVGANSPSLWPTIDSLTNTGT